MLFILFNFCRIPYRNEENCSHVPDHFEIFSHANEEENVNRLMIFFILIFLLLRKRRDTELFRLDVSDKF